MELPCCYAHTELVISDRGNGQAGRRPSAGRAILGQLDVRPRRPRSTVRPVRGRQPAVSRVNSLGGTPRGRRLRRRGAATCVKRRLPRARSQTGVPEQIRRPCRQSARVATAGGEAEAGRRQSCSWTIPVQGLPHAVSGRGGRPASGLWGVPHRAPSQLRGSDRTPGATCPSCTASSQWGPRYRAVDVDPSCPGRDVDSKGLAVRLSRRCVSRPDVRHCASHCDVCV